MRHNPYPLHICTFVRRSYQKIKVLYFYIFSSNYRSTRILWQQNWIARTNSYLFSNVMVSLWRHLNTSLWKIFLSYTSIVFFPYVIICYTSNCTKSIYHFTVWPLKFIKFLQNLRIQVYNKNNKLVLIKIALNYLLQIRVFIFKQKLEKLSDFSFP